MNKNSIIRQNVEQAIHKTFNIKKTCNPINTVIEEGIEITGLSVASQEARELNDMLKIEGHQTMFDFAPNGKWSVLNMNKIKAQWANRCKQTIINNIPWNIIPGKWNNGKFLPHMLSKNIRVEITPSKKIDKNRNSIAILIRHSIHKSHSDISELVPHIMFDKIELKCVSPISIYNTSINRQGIYINRKYREKTQICTLPKDHMYPTIYSYKLDIYYIDQLLSSQNI